jgi:hypothetical protein
VLNALLDQTAHLYSKEMVASLRTQLEQGETELVTELLAPRISGPAIAATLHEKRFAGGKPGTREAGLLRELSKLPFSGVVTDMWAAIPESLFAGRDPVTVVPSEDSSLQQLLRTDTFFVAHLHGILERPETLWMSWQQYREALTESREFERFMASLNSSRSFLCLGVSEETVELFFQASSLYRQRGRRHFALVPWRPGLDLRAQSFRDRFGVELLPYAPSAGDRDFLHFVERLNVGLSGHGRRAQRRQPSSSPRAESVSLKNIGPFESLELPLHRQATVLLGDNSSGKSSVLRAISLALSGEGPDVDRAAHGLLRTGTSSGHIELRFEGERFYTALRREGTAQVSVRAEQLSPVAAGLWLGLGFPPLRGTSRAALQGPSAESLADPSASDVFPLAGNWVDDRLGDVQQWVINTALRAEARSGQASKRMLETFFSIVGDLTPGVHFEFLEIDRETWRVLLKTEDGVLALDQLSRGMTAMFSWVGVLLQRLFEIYGDGQESPEDNRALLLVDEIDLHLHPAWQRRVLPLICRHFPNVQLVASTHSPLVVGSLIDASFIHLQRVGGQIESAVLDADFAGWRSDQILTGPAFELPTTRDPDTQSQMKQYSELLGRGAPTDEEKKRVGELEALLRKRVPGPQETEVERTAANLVRDAIQQQLAGLPAERRQELAEEAERHLAQLRSGREDK